VSQLAVRCQAITARGATRSVKFLLLVPGVPDDVSAEGFEHGDVFGHRLSLQTENCDVAGLWRCRYNGFVAEGHKSLPQAARPQEVVLED